MNFGTNRTSDCKLPFSSVEQVIPISRATKTNSSSSSSTSKEGKVSSQSSVFLSSSDMGETTISVEFNREDTLLVTAPHMQDGSRSSISCHGMSMVGEPESCRDTEVSVDQPTRSNNPLRCFLESSIFKSNQTIQQEREMKEIEASVQTTILAPKQMMTHQKDDKCRKYSNEQVSDNDDDDDDDDNHRLDLHQRYFNDKSNIVANTRADLSLSLSKISSSYVLGKIYHPTEYDARRNDEMSLFWFTYRCDFPCIEPYGIISDAGWGCMLRALQMMMGQALRMHYKSRDWRPQQSLALRRQDAFLRSILTWFADFPSSKESIYSIHNMVAAGLAKYDKLPGEWYGPGTACHVLKDLVEIHEKFQQKNHRLFRVHVATGGTVYRDTIENVVASTAKAARAKQTQLSQNMAHPLDSSWDDELVDVFGGAGQISWDTALLLLIPLRLGLNSFNSDYVGLIAHTFSLPQSVGILGGRPRGARWFYGALADGSKIFGLDPHTVQAAPQRRMTRDNGQPSSVVEISDEYMRSVHTTSTEVYSLAKLDPSIALGFYCRGQADLDHVFTSFNQWKKDHPNSPELFTVADKPPDYESQTPTIDKMFESLMDDSNNGIDGTEEDEFVLL